MIALLRGVADPAIRAEDVVIARESSDAESELRLVRPACTRTQPLICPTVLRLISNSPLSNNRMEHWLLTCGAPTRRNQFAALFGKAYHLR